MCSPADLLHLNSRLIFLRLLECYHQTESIEQQDRLTAKEFISIGSERDFLQQDSGLDRGTASGRALGSLAREARHLVNKQRAHKPDVPPTASRAHRTWGFSCGYYYWRCCSAMGGAARGAASTGEAVHTTELLRQQGVLCWTTGPWVRRRRRRPLVESSRMPRLLDPIPRDQWDSCETLRQCRHPPEPIH
jgi:hypothetical protein